MSLPRYSEYKDSGVEWLGEVPGHWEVWKLSHAFDVIGSGTTPKSDNAAYYEDGQTAWVNTGDLNDGELYDCEKRVTDLALAEHSSLKIFPSGSLAIAMYGATIGKLAMLQFPATVNQACCVFVEGAQVQSKFLFYWFAGLRQQIISLATGGGQPNISQEILRGLRLACPTHSEQKTIAAFLDRETGKIDALIDEQRRLVELLAEKRQAVISHAVTKGLTPNAKMKDSGIEWLGEVPEHWEVVPMKYLVRFQSGGTPSKEQLDYWDGSLPWASAKDMKVEFLSDTEDHITELAIEHGAATLLDIGAVLVVVRGMILARTFPVTLTRARMAINQDLKAVLPRDSLDSNFLAWYLRGTANESLSRLDEAGHGTKALRMDRWASLEIALPSIEEQVAIAAFINSVSAKFDTLTAEANRAIALLQERRSALISTAVTGKVDVRKLA